MTTPSRTIGKIACIVIDGADARRFAQAQFSGDVAALAPGHWQWNAWLTAQGRVRALMHLADAGDGKLLAVLRGGDAESICAALARFVFRMHVRLAVQRFSGSAGAAVPDAAVGIDADGAITLGYGTRSLILSPAATPIHPATQTEWCLQDIRRGWPRLPTVGEPAFLPPALGLEHLGAVAFDKGCYPGQEIAARLHYRGGHKFRLCHLRGSKPPPTGSARIGDDTKPAEARPAWLLAEAAGSEGVQALAVISVDTIREINILGNIYSVISMFDA